MCNPFQAFLQEPTAQQNTDWWWENCIPFDFDQLYTIYYFFRPTLNLRKALLLKNRISSSQCFVFAWRSGIQNLCIHCSFSSQFPFVPVLRPSPSPCALSTKHLKNEKLFIRRAKGKLNKMSKANKHLNPYSYSLLIISNFFLTFAQCYVDKYA